MKANEQKTSNLSVILYSRKDKDWKDRLVNHLVEIRQSGFMTFRSEQNIRYFDEQQIQKENSEFPIFEKTLQQAGTVILLISANFLVSGVISKKEILNLLERRRKEGVDVKPLILHPWPLGWRWSKLITNPFRWISLLRLIRIRPYLKDGKDLSDSTEEEIETYFDNLGKELTETVVAKREMMPEGSMIVVDDIYEIEDKIGYADYVTGIVEMIKSVKAKGAFTIGVYGEWGQGKTSMLRQIENKTLLEIDKNQILTIWFNPWRFSSERHLIIPFFNTFVAYLKTYEEKNKNQSWFKSINTKISMLIKEFAHVPIALAYGCEAEFKVPFLLKAKFNVAKAIDEARSKKKEIEKVEMGKSTRTYEKAVEKYESLYYNLLEHLKKATEDLDMKIVVFIDDLDRCLPDKALDLLEGLKILLDLPGFVFIIGVARGGIEQGIYYRYKDIIEKNNADMHIFCGDYLEKIIQFPLTIPPADENQLKAHIDELMKELKAVTPYIGTIIKALEQNVRRLKRFINNISYSLKIAELKDNTGKLFVPELLIKMTLIAFRLPDLYIKLGKNPRLLREIQKRLNDEIYEESKKSKDDVKIEETKAKAKEKTENDEVKESQPKGDMLYNENIHEWLREPYYSILSIILRYEERTINGKKEKDRGFSDSEEVKRYVGMLAPAIETEYKPATKKVKEIKEDHKELEPVYPIPKISTFKLPVTGEFFFGRERELKSLDEAWADGHIHIVTLVAWGGVGKTALVNRWLSHMGKDNYGGAKRVYAWSFYSQGAEEGKQASADEFMQETLKWFGDDDPTAGSAVDKGRRLARLVREENTLLILDGMEPLQYPPGQVHGLDGKLKDTGMRAFLRELSGGFNGLCIITSRERVTDLEDKKNLTVMEMELVNLSLDAGAELLRRLGVKGSDKDILKAADEYEGHALALTLMGQYITSAYKGDIRKRDSIPNLTGERIQGGHARRVMEIYEKRLGESAEKDILYIMGLFDRPAEIGAIEALKAEPAIPGVTDQLMALSEEDWNRALFNLRAAHLLAAENPQKTDVLDCHPLIREHFGQKLQKQNPKGWKESHKRLYNYFKTLPKKEFPDTLQEMEPLFTAIAHGCRAGLYEDVLAGVYWKRIARKNEVFSIKKLGAVGADLATLSHFFEVPWSKPVSWLLDNVKAVVMNWAAFRLRALGRLREAIQPMKAGLEIRVKQKVWESAAIDASNLSELMLTLGEVKAAVVYGHQSVTHADRSGDRFMTEATRSTYADALHHSGQLGEAEVLFREAEAKQRERQPEYPFLYSLRGYQFCDLLLGQAQNNYQEVIKRAEKTLEWAGQQMKSILDFAINNLTLGRAWMIKTEKEGARYFRQAFDYLDQAVEGLRDAAHQEFLVRGLLARAACYRLQGNLSRAWEDLNEAKEISELGDMKLHLVDYHIEAARLSSAEGKDADADFHFKTAAKMIRETGYHRRDAGIMNDE